MDVVSILSKMKLMDKVEDFRVVMEYERAEDYPKVYKKVYKWVRIKYIWGCIKKRAGRKNKGEMISSPPL